MSFAQSFGKVVVDHIHCVMVNSMARFFGVHNMHIYKDNYNSIQCHHN